MAAPVPEQELRSLLQTLAKGHYWSELYQLRGLYKLEPYASLLDRESTLLLFKASNLKGDLHAVDEFMAHFSHDEGYLEAILHLGMHFARYDTVSSAYRLLKQFRAHPLFSLETSTELLFYLSSSEATELLVWTLRRLSPKIRDSASLPPASEEALLTLWETYLQVLSRTKNAEVVSHCIYRMRQKTHCPPPPLARDRLVELFSEFRFFDPCILELVPPPSPRCFSTLFESINPQLFNAVKAVENILSDYKVAFQTDQIDELTLNAALRLASFSTSPALVEYVLNLFEEQGMEPSERSKSFFVRLNYMSNMRRGENFKQEIRETGQAWGDSALAVFEQEGDFTPFEKLFHTINAQMADRFDQMREELPPEEFEAVVRHYERELADYPPLPSLTEKVPFCVRLQTHFSREVAEEEKQRQQQMASFSPSRNGHVFNRKREEDALDREDNEDNEDNEEEEEEEDKQDLTEAVKTYHLDNKRRLEDYASGAAQFGGRARRKRFSPYVNSFNILTEMNQERPFFHQAGVGLPWSSFHVDRIQSGGWEEEEESRDANVSISEVYNTRMEELILQEIEHEEEAEKQSSAREVENFTKEAEGDEGDEEEEEQEEQEEEERFRLDEARKRSRRPASPSTTGGDKGEEGRGEVPMSSLRDEIEVVQALSANVREEGGEKKERVSRRAETGRERPPRRLLNKIDNRMGGGKKRQSKRGGKHQGKRDGKRQGKHQGRKQEDGQEDGQEDRHQSNSYDSMQQSKRFGEGDKDWEGSAWPSKRKTKKVLREPRSNLERKSSSIMESILSSLPEKRQ